MTQRPIDDKTDSVPLDAKLVRAVVLAVVVGSVPINQGINYLTPQVRSDPFTGTDGQEMKAQLRREFADDLLLIENQLVELRKEFEGYRRVDEERVHIIEQRINALRERMERVHGK